MNAKVRSNVYLDTKLKEDAKEIFKSYGLSFSDGVNFLLKQATDKKSLILTNDLNIEPVHENDPDYKIMQEAKQEDTISLDEFMKV